MIVPHLDAAQPLFSLLCGFDQRLTALARDFENDEDTIKRTEACKQKRRTAPEATTFFAHTWEECKRARGRLLRGTPPQDPALARDRAKLLDRLGDRVREDPFIRQMINEQLKAALPALAERERHEVSTKIRETVTGWDTHETADRIELSIGRDLQCIQINGTLVGGVVGLRISSLSHWLFSGAGSPVLRRKREVRSDGRDGWPVAERGHASGPRIALLNGAFLHVFAPEKRLNGAFLHVFAPEKRL